MQGHSPSGNDAFIALTLHLRNIKLRKKGAEKRAVSFIYFVDNRSITTINSLKMSNAKMYVPMFVFNKKEKLPF